MVRSPYHQRVLIITAINMAAMLAVAHGQTFATRLFGVMLASFGLGAGQTTFFSLLSYFNSAAISGFSAGTGAAGVVAAGVYYLLTVVLNTPVSKTLRLVATLLPVNALSYAFLVAPHRRAKGTVTTDEQSKELRTQTASTWQLVVHSGVSRYFFPLFSIYIVTFLTNHAVLPHVHQTRGSGDSGYVLFFFIYQVAVFLSRSSLQLLTLKHQSQLWVLVGFQTVAMLCLLGHALESFILPVEPVMLVACMGLASGSCYVNSFNLIQKHTKPECQEFAMGFGSVATTAGPVVAALCGLFVESRIISHSPGPHPYNLK
eukprot:TRINITY_DN26839_c0_g1_i2.p1 TRINITY_DN26839_c0_g1~~TRINITY_DN26839_c0_g1_i2.p1  ORF type:complete len:316 (+),score=67.01 TRINITY_DN26839_c0_g1_i2:116-1063(+)